MDNPFTRKGLRSRRASLWLAALTILAPCGILVATLPGNGNDGFIDIGSLWLWHKKAPTAKIPGQPQLILDGTSMRISLVVLCGLFSVALVVIAFVKHSDHGLLFGGATVFVALTTAAAFVSVFTRKHVEDQAGGTFALLSVLSVIVLVLTAHDWARRQLMIAAVIAVAGLSVFLLRVGFESLKVPPQWERAQIAERAEAQESALQLQHKSDRLTLRKTATSALANLNSIVKGPPRPNVSSDLLATARVIIDRADEPIKNDKADNTGDFSKFDAQAVNEDVGHPPAAVTKLADAVHALQATESALVARVSPEALDQAICVVDPPGKCQPRRPDTITTNLLWVTAQHKLDVELATYRAEVTGTQADQSALQAVLAQQPAADGDISILAAIENGPQTLWRSAFHATGPALDPGPFGWAVLGALLFGLLSWLLKVNASQLAGPVSVESTGSGDGNEQLTAALRVAVLQNVAEPGAAPGSPSINPVTTLLDIAGGPLSAMGKIIPAVQAVVGRRYGYRVTVDVTSGDLAGPGPMTNDAGATPAPPAGGITVLVRVMSLTSGITYSSHLCTAPQAIEAVRTAGLWAAGDILNRSSRIPHWAAWEAETAHALVTAKDGTEHTLPDLKAALADAPNSGILLVLLGHHYELAAQPLDAIACYARAVTAYPRYSVARYRLAATLASLQHDQNWSSTSTIMRREGTLQAVRWAVEALEVNGAPAMRNPKGKKFDQEAEEKNFSRDDCAPLADRLLRALEFDMKLVYRLVGALRRSERESIWPTLAPMSQHPAARFPALVRSARQALNSREREKLYEEANMHDSWWQISYNAACAHAVRIAEIDSELPVAEPGRPLAEEQEQEKREKQKDQEEEGRLAIALLEQTLVRPGVEQLSADWVSHDPDLTTLRSLPRFTRFLAQLRPGG